MSILGYLMDSLRASKPPAPKARGKGKAATPPRKPTPVKAAAAVEDPEAAEIATRQAKPFVMPSRERQLSAAVSLCIDAGGIHAANRFYQRRVRQEWHPELVEWLSAMGPDEIARLATDIRIVEIASAKFLSRKRNWKDGEDRNTLQVGAQRLDRRQDLDLIHDLAARVSGAGVEVLESIWLQSARDLAERAAAVDGAPPPAAPSTAGISAPPEPEPFPFDLEEEPEEPPPWPGARL